MELLANTQLRMVDVKEFGAKGDGSHDDTSAIQQAINYAFSEGGSTVYFPDGRYRITATLKLPAIERPNTLGTKGSGFTIKGAGMYDSGIIYSGTDYAMVSEEELAESILFQDFYINHANGGGIRLPQGAHQWFDRFFSSACALGKYGVLIEGNRAGTDPDAGYGSYMTSFNHCRFWSETGYNGTGVRLENIVLCTLFTDCFFSRSVQNVPHLELYQCHGVHIASCAFERSEQTVTLPPEVINDPNLTDEQKEEIRKSMSREANNRITESLIKIDNSHSVSVLECHAEAAYPSFIGIFNHSSNIVIDGCRLNHYAISDYNEQKGYIVDVDPESNFSSNIILGRRNRHMQSNHPMTTHGEIINDPVKCVTALSFQDVTPFSDAFYLTERRTISRLGASGTNLLKNPGFYSDQAEGIPFGIEPVSGQWSFSQLAPSGCRIIQSAEPPDIPYTLRTRTSEVLNKYEVYTLHLVARNLTGESVSMWLDIGGDGNDTTVHLPSGNQLFTMSFPIQSKQTDIIDLVVYRPMELELIAVYVIPNNSYEVPYGSELLTASKLNLGAEIKYGTAIPESGGSSGDLVFNRTPSQNQELGWMCLAPGQWIPFSKTVSGVIEGVPELPAAEEARRGAMMRWEREGYPDFVYICKKLADGSYDWIRIG